MTPSEIIIRRFKPSDAGSCAAIMSENKLWQRYGVTYEKALRRFSSADPTRDLILIAEISGAPAGFCWYVPKGAFNRCGYIQLIGVAPNKQGQGIGEALLQEAEALCSAESSEMFLTVSDFNISAQAFYHRMGYEQAGALPGFVLPDITELIYRKRLRDPQGEISSSGNPTG